MTKAERFNDQLQKSRHHKPKQPKHGKPNHPQHNEAARAGRHSVYALERPGSKPSRKSTRKSANRQKHDGQLKASVIARMSAPSERASRSSGNRNG